MLYQLSYTRARTVGQAGSRTVPLTDSRYSDAIRDQIFFPSARPSVRPSA